MKFSLITPTHSPDNREFLLELFDSILEQTHSDWEWVLYLNNGMNAGHLPTRIVEHPSVKVFEQKEYNDKIGFIKNKAFHLGTGDILVEMDHDDLLMPDCLKKLNEIFEKNEHIGFVYSNNVSYQMDEKFIPYDEDMGWTYETVKFRGEDEIAMHSFPPSSHSMAYIWFSPDHIRAWRATTYREIGGHNVELSICDDHELTIRTYLATEMHQIAEPLYIYRITGNNTWLQRCDAIQKKTIEISDQYMRELAERDADKNNLLKIDLGGGLNPFPGYKTIDLRDSADIVADLNNGIPLPDNSVGVLNAHHILEHLKDQQFIMSEIHRVLVDGGWAFIEVPSTEGRGAFQDPTHVTYWNQNSFLYWTHREQANYIDNKDIRFQEYKLIDYYPNEFMKDRNILITCAVLVALKDEKKRYPGARHI